MASFISAQTTQGDQELAQVRNLLSENRYIEALPLLEKAAPRYPNNAELQASFGVAILANSVTIREEGLRKNEILRAAQILRKAKQLGTQNVLALHYLDKIEEGDDIGVAFNTSNKEVENAIREGEVFFGRGEYDKAFLAYERAYKLDPKNYDAALFAGDSFYAQKKFSESEIWFAKAVALDPNREQGYRFWSDALANQGKFKEALDKIADAFIAEPSSRLVFDALIKAVRNFGSRSSSPFIVIPSKSDSEVTIDTSDLKAEDGTIYWNKFTEIRNAQIEKFNKVANGRGFSATLSEDVEALKGVAATARRSSQVDKNLKLSKSMENLIKLDDLGMLDIYTMFFIQGGDNSPEYINFREKNRERMKNFLVNYFAEDKL